LLKKTHRRERGQPCLHERAGVQKSLLKFSLIFVYMFTPLRAVVGKDARAPKNKARV